MKTFKDIILENDIKINIVDNYTTNVIKKMIQQMSVLFMRN